MSSLYNARRYHRRSLRRERIFRDRNNPLDNDDDFNLIANYCIPRSEIFDLIDLLYENTLQSYKNYAIHPSLQTIIALRFLATGSVYSIIADATGVSRASVCQIIRRFCHVVSSRVSDFININVQNLNTTASKFCSIANFPNVLGCIDGSQFAIKCPSQNEAVYVNRKGFHSLNVQLVCDSDLIITDIVVKYPGSTHDAFIFQFSALHRRLQSQEFPHSWLLGDSGYPNLPYLLTPVGNPISTKERHYNRAHRKTRVKIECAIGVLKARFLCLSQKVSGPLLFSAEVANTVISTCCCLHNIARRERLPDPNNVEAEINEEETTESGTETILQNTAGEITRRRLIDTRFERAEAEPSPV